MNWEVVAFGILTAVTVFAAYRVVTTPVVTHAALFLALAFVGLAGFFLLLGSPFLAAVQVLIYAGAVMTVMIFAIMLSEMSEIREVTAAEAARARGWLGRVRLALASPYWGYLPLLVSAGLLALLVVIYRSVSWPGASGTPPTEVTRVIGREMFSTFLVPFEITSALLLVALIGAIVLTKKGDEGQ